MEHVAIVCLTRVGTNHMFILQKHEKKIVRLSPACAPLIWVPLRIGLALVAQNEKLIKSFLRWIML